MPLHSPIGPATLLVLSTAYVVTPTGAPYYEIIAATDHDAYAPRLFIRTRDEGLYRRALDVEGTERRVRITLHARRDRSRWRDLVDLVPAS
jgi:hypothetical protein